MKNYRMYVAYLLIAAMVGSCYLAFVGVDRVVIGLSQNILGSIVVAIFGIPQPDFSTHIVLGLSIPDEEERLKRDQHGRKVWHMTCSYLGITLLMTGFLLQLWCHLWP